MSRLLPKDPGYRNHGCTDNVKMESKWYFFPGQTVENTKISDRQHALHITEKAWGNITQHLDRKKRIQDAVDKERAHRQALKDGSREMTKEWKDSIENLRLKKDKERHERIGQKKEDKMQLFYKMRAEQESVRQDIIANIRKRIFMSTGHPKELTSALVLSETLYERNKQKEFDRMRKQRETDINRKMDEGILRQDQIERQKDKEEKQQRLEAERKVARNLLEQIRENEETRKEQTRRHIERETQDSIKAAEEIELMKQYEVAKKEHQRREIQQDQRKEIEEDIKRQQRLKKENEEFEMAVRFYSEAKERIDCLKKTKEKALRDETIAKRFEAASKVAAARQAQDDVENQRMARIIAERDAEEHAKAQAKLALKAKEREERINDRKEHLERSEKEKRAEDEMKRWEMLNRMKTAEVMQEYDKRVLKEKWMKILEYRQELLQQMAEGRQIKKDEKEIDEIMSRVSHEQADKMFFEYADEVLQLAKSKNRDTYPIEKVIMGYKKFNNLLPKNHIVSSCRHQI